MEGLPKFPNWASTLGSSAPVVSTLAAGISAVALAATFQSGFKSQDLLPGGASWKSGDAVLALGVVSLFLFAATTIALIYAQASNFDALTIEQQQKLLENAREQAAGQYQKDLRDQTWRYLSVANLLAMAGFILLALTLGALLFGHIRALAVILSVMAALISLGLARAGPDLPLKLGPIRLCALVIDEMKIGLTVVHRVTGLLLAVVSVAFFLSSVLV